MIANNRYCSNMKSSIVSIFLRRHHHQHNSLLYYRSGSMTQSFSYSNAFVNNHHHHHQHHIHTMSHSNNIQQQLFPSRNISSSRSVSRAIQNELSLSLPTIDDFTKKIADRMLAGDRSALSKAITLVESKRYQDHVQAQALLQYVISERQRRQQQQQQQQQQSHQENKETFRVGISGPPGAGKSTFIECIGQLLIQKGHRVAVLAVDPSSTRTGGSILGDKTRMNELSKSQDAFVRPSPSQGFLGGVTANMYEIILLCECAGYDRILVETVGVGQSETQVADLTDMVLLLVPPSGGDELQGIKRGIVEVADLIVVNKTDGNLIPVARRSQREYKNALHFMSPRSVVIDEDNPFLKGRKIEDLKPWYPDVMCCSSSAHTNFGREEDMTEDARKYSVRNVMEKMNEYQVAQHDNGQWYHRRREQRKGWLWKQVNEDLVTRLLHHSEKLKGMVKDLQNRVGDGKLSPRIASELILQEFVAEHANSQK